MYNYKRNFRKLTLFIVLLTFFINIPFNGVAVQEILLSNDKDKQPLETLSKLTMSNAQIVKSEISTRESFSLSKEKSPVNSSDIPEFHKAKVEPTAQEVVRPSSVSIETGHCTDCGQIVVPRGITRNMTFSFRPYLISSISTPAELRFTLNGTVLERHNWTLNTWYNYTLYYGSQVGIFDFVAEFEYILSVTVSGVVYNTTLSAIREFQINVFQPYVLEEDDSDDSDLDNSTTDDSSLPLPPFLLLDPVSLNCAENSNETKYWSTCTESPGENTRLDQEQNQNQTFNWEFHTNFPHKYTIELVHIDFGTTTLLETANLQSNKTFEYTIYSSNYTIRDSNPDDPHFSNSHTYGNQYFLQVTAYDLYGSWIRTQQRIIVQDVTRPVITFIPDQSYEYATPPPSLLINLYDANPKVYSFSIYTFDPFEINELVSREPWGNGNLTLQLPDNLPQGRYVFYFIAWGIGEALINSRDQYFSLTVTPPKPPVFISHPNSTETYQTHTQGLNLQWNVTDFAPALYNLTINGSLYVINQPWNSGEIISFLHTNDASGTYIYNLTVSDVVNLVSFHSIKVIPIDTVAPIISRGNTLAYPVDTSGNFLAWTAHDISLTGTYSLTSNFLNKQGSWNSGQKVEILLDGLPLGFHLINLTVSDKLGNQAEDIFSILIYTSVEINTKPADVYHEYGNMSEPLSWISTSNYAANYHLFLNGQKIRNNVPWNSGVEVSFPISSLKPGRYEFRIEFYDSFSNLNLDTVIVTVVDTTDPIVLGLNDAIYEIDNVQGKLLNFTIHEFSEFSYFVRINGNLLDFGNSSSYSLNFNSLSLGHSIVSVTVIDSFGNQIEHLASIILQDTISPRLLIASTPSLYELSYSAPLASWQVVDSFPATYTIMLNNTIFETGIWKSASTVSFFDSRVSPGIYSVLFTAEDESGNIVVDSFIVKVQDTSKPQLAATPENGTISFYELQQIQWLINDESGGGSYTLRKNDVIVKTGNWSALLPIEYNLYATSYENFVLSLSVADYSGNTLISERTFTLQLQGTTKIEPLDDLYLEDPPDTVQLVWFPQNFGVAIYTVTVDGYFIFRDQLWFPSSTINVSLPFLLPGVYLYELTFVDFLGNTASDDVVVTIQDKNPPKLEFSTLILEYSATMISLLWTASDAHPENYTILDQEGNSYSGTWESEEINSLSLTGKTVGKYNFTFIVRDSLNYVRTEEITVEIVDTNTPVITGITTHYEYTREDLIFSIQDTSYGNYQIFDTTGFSTTGSWSANELITIPLSHLELGFYNFTFLVLDAGGNFVRESFEFTICDTVAPLLSHISAITLNYNSVAETIVWYPVDLDPDTYTITMNDTVVQAGNWGSQIEFVIPNLPISKNFLKLSIFDGSNNTASTVIIITIIDTVAPKLSGLKQVLVEYGDNSQTLSWEIEDSSPWQFNITVNDFNLVENALDNISAQISLSELTVGRYNYTLTVIDNSGNSASMTTEVVVHDTTAPLIFAEDESFRTVTLATQLNTVELVWVAIDISPSTFTILLNNSMVLTTNWITNSASYHSQLTALGIYNYTVIFTDNSSNTATHSYLIEVIDTQSAQIQNDHETFTLELGSTGQSIDWQIIDHLENNYIILKTSTNEFSKGLTVNELIASTNATIVASGYCSQNCTISYQLPGITTLRNIQYTLLSYDRSKNLAINTVNLNIVDTTAPEFVMLPEDNYSISDRASWAVFDYQTVSYEIQIDGIRVASGNYKIGSRNDIDLSGLAVDTQHSLILTATDASGNVQNFKTVFRTYLSLNSVESAVKHLSLEAGNTEQTLSWKKSATKENYKFYVNSNLLKVGTFGTESSFNHFLAELNVGEYNFTFVQSAFGVSETSTTLVTVADTIVPVLTVEAFQGKKSKMVLLWTAFDLNPDTYTILLNDVLLEAGTWASGREHHLVLKNLEPDIYRFRIIISDTHQNGNNTIIEFVIDGQTAFPISIYFNIYVMLLLGLIAIPVLIRLARKRQ